MVETTANAPRKSLLLLEGRAIPELFGFAAALPTLSALVPRGDGQPVLILPGLTAGDSSTVSMRRFLKTKGYPTYGWKMGLNLGPRPGVEQGLIDLVENLADKYDRKVSIVGWSLGGIYARQLGKMMPKLIRQVISMGSPFGGSPRATNAWRVYEMASGQSSHDGERHMGGAISAPAPVPSTAIYSKTDGICAWQNCIEEKSEIAENIEVRGSHCGLGHHPAAVYAVADRLAQPEGEWQPFDRSGVKGMIFPKPEYPV
ncbi:esterase/lipase family protein [Sulfitobacter sp. JB4-11]|uniref:esterase/lipase family protein n=1 Tax=Sulfitobacter rhodophyticola TaxID=3238304 RepID=UPI0035121D90